MQALGGILFISTGITLVIAAGPLDRLRRRIGVQAPTVGGVPLPSTSFWMPFPWAIRLGGVFAILIGVLLLTGHSAPR
jgi:hypothetical protein